MSEMKKLACLLITANILLFYARPSQSAQTNNINLGGAGPLAPYIYQVVASTNGLMASLISARDKVSTTNINPEQPLLISFNHPGKMEIVYVPKDQYFGAFSLYDASNNRVPPTELGETFKLDSNLEWDEKYIRQHGNGMAAFWRVGNEWSRPVDLPSPSKLFKIEKSGKYKIIFEFQVFLKIGSNKDLVRFPPFEISLIKP